MGPPATNAQGIPQQGVDGGEEEPGPAAPGQRVHAEHTTQHGSRSMKPRVSRGCPVPEQTSDEPRTPPNTTTKTRGNLIRRWHLRASRRRDGGLDPHSSASIQTAGRPDSCREPKASSTRRHARRKPTPRGQPVPHAPCYGTYPGAVLGGLGLAHSYHGDGAEQRTQQTQASSDGATSTWQAFSFRICSEQSSPGCTSTSARLAERSSCGGIRQGKRRPKQAATEYGRRLSTTACRITLGSRRITRGNGCPQRIAERRASPSFGRRVYCLTS